MQCNSSWAYATVAAIEAQLYLNQPSLPRTTYLSVQQVMDCAWPQPLENTCVDGNPIDAMNYTMAAGITYDTDYPYVGNTGSVKCKLTSQSIVTQPRGVWEIPMDGNAELNLAKVSIFTLYQSRV